MGEGLRTSKRKRKGYWKTYDARYRNASLRSTYLQILGRALKLPSPYAPGARGPQPKLSAHEAAALLVFKVHLDLSLRDLEMHSESLVGSHVDHSTIDDKIQRVPVEWLHQLNAQFDKEVQRLLRDVAWVFMTDSTKIALRRQYEERAILTQETHVASLEPLHVFAGYAPQVGVLTIPSGHAGVMGEVAAFHENLARVPPERTTGKGLFADRGHDAQSAFRDSYEREMHPFIKQRATGTSRGYRGKAQRTWDPEAYRDTRGVVEGIFGGLETRTRLRSRCRKPQSQQRETLCMALSHNLQSLMRVQTFSEVGTPAA